MKTIATLFQAFAMKKHMNKILTVLLIVIGTQHLFAQQTARLHFRDAQTLNRTAPTGITVASTGALSKTTASFVAIGTVVTSAQNGTVPTNNAVTFSNYNVAAGSDRLIMVSIGTGLERAVTSVTFGGQAMTKLGSAADAESGVEMWYRLLGNSGSATSGDVVINFAAGTSAIQYSMNVINFSGVNQTLPFGSVVGTNISSSTISYNVPSNVGDVIIDAMAIRATGGSGLSPNTGQELVYSTSNSKFRSGSSRKAATSGTTSMGWTNGSSGSASALAAAIKGQATEVAFASASGLLCSDFVIKAGTNINILAHAAVDGTPITALTNGPVPVRARLLDGATLIGEFSTATNTGLAGANSTGTLAWAGTIPTAYTLTPSSNLRLEFISDLTSANIRIDYNATTKSSYIDLPTDGYLTVSDVSVHNTANNVSDPITSKTVGDNAYLRMTVTNAFGAAEIGTPSFVLAGPVNPTFTPTEVAAVGCTKVYEYEWTTSSAGIYNITGSVTAGAGEVTTATNSTSGFEVLAKGGDPIAAGDFYCISASDVPPINLEVLSNDTHGAFDGTSSNFLNTASTNDYELTIISGPALGTATVTGLSVSFDPTGGTAMTENSTTSFVYRITVKSDPTLFAEATVAILYSSSNTPPVALSDVSFTTVGLPVVINILANDSDADGTLGTPTITVAPLYGSVVVNQDKTVTYTPFPGFEGIDAFTYQICDVDRCGYASECSTAEVTITVADAYYACQEGSSTFTLSAIPGAEGYKWSFPAGVVINSTYTGTITNPVTETPTIAVSWSALSAGNYQVCVAPTNDCGDATGECVNVVLNSVTVVPTANNVTCSGAANGSITLAISGGIAPYTFVWEKDGSSYPASVQNPGGLSPGTYDVTVTDRFGCVRTITGIVITEPAAGLSISETTTPASPFNTANGSIDLTVSGGTAPYTYVWSDGTNNIATSEDLTNVVSGFYSVTVTDANGCSFNKTIALGGVNAPLNATLVEQDVLCFGGATGSIDLQVIGGTPFSTGDYAYSWVATNGGIVPSGQQNAQDLSGLVAGTYTVTITDDASGSIQKTAIITQPAAALSASAAGTNLSCYESNDGQVVLTLSGGTAPFTYLWNTGSTTKDLSGLGAGPYSVTVTDANGCTASANATLTEPAELVVTETIVNATCSNSDGGVSVVVSGGTGGYTYLWSTGATTDAINNLLPGSYSVTVTDGNNCTSSATYTVRKACIEITNSVLTGPTNNGDGTYTLTYQMIVKNTGTVALSDISVENDLLATYGIGNFTNIGVTTSGNFSKNNNFNGNSDKELLATNNALVPNGQGTINLTVTVTPSDFASKNPFVNTATATAEDAGNKTVSDDDNANVTFLEQPQIGIAKALTAGPSIQSDGSYNMSFTITVRNYGDVVLNNVQVTDDLDAVFGPNTYTVTAHTVSTGFTKNTSFDGSGDQNLLDGSTPLGINETRTISFSVNVVPSNAGSLENSAIGSASGPGGTPTTDLSHDGLNPLPDNTQTPANFNDKTPVTLPEAPEIGAAKRLVGLPINNNDGTYTVNYQILVRNYGDVKLFNVQVVDDLATVFSASKVVSATATSATFTVNNDFDGVNDKNLLAVGNDLPLGTSKTIDLAVTIAPGDDLGPYNNTATASGRSAQDVLVSDVSNDGNNPDPNGDGPANYSAVTPVSFTEAPVIGANMSIVSNTNNKDGSYDLVVAIGLTNFGNVPLKDVAASYVFATNFPGGATVTYLSHTASSGLDVNTAFDGATDANLLSNTSVLDHNATGTIALTIRVVPGINLGPYNTSVTATAAGTGGTIVTDVSQNGNDADPDNDGNPNNNSQPTPVTFTEDGRLGLAKDITSGPTETTTGTYQLTYDIRVENMSTGDVPINNIQVVDELFETFAGYTSTDVTVNGLSILTQPATSTWSVDNNYDGFTNTELLSGTTGLKHGEFAVIRLVVSVNTTVKNLGGPFENSAIGTGQTPGGAFLIDLSQDGASVDPSETDIATDDNEATPVVLFDNSGISLTKIVSSVAVISPTRNLVTIGLRVANTGGTRVCNLALIDDIVTQFAGSNPSNFATTEGDLLILTQSWNGAGSGAGSNILEANQCLEVGDIDTVYIQFVIDNGPDIYFGNTATLSGTGPSNNPVTSNGQADIYTVPFTNPDVNITHVGYPISGNIATNDLLPTGFTYNTAFIADNGNPAGAVLTLNSIGTYTFIAPLAGVYRYAVEVCASGATPPQTTGCITEELTITVLENTGVHAPVAVPDIAYTLQGNAVVLNTLANDAAYPGFAISGAQLSFVTIPNIATEGAVSINPSTGDITFTPVADFTGKVTFEYEVCDNQSPTACATATQTVYVFPTGTPNSIFAADDHAIAMGSLPLVGNVLANDKDPEGHPMTITAQNVTLPGIGTFLLTTSGEYTFTAVPGYTGALNFVYQVCDDQTPAACAEATLYILVKDQITRPDANFTWTNTVVTGNVNTNDAVVSSTVYGAITAGVVPSGSNPNLVLQPNGSYTFSADLAGVYNYSVEVCAPGQLPSESPTQCGAENLVITVLNPLAGINVPATAPDFAVMQGYTSGPAPTVTLDVRSNDVAGNAGASLDAPTISGAPDPLKGTAVVNGNGTITFTPVINFFGVVSFTYQVCEAPATALCKTEVVFVTVLEPQADKKVIASDDFNFTDKGTTISVSNAVDGVLNNDFTSGAGPVTAALVGGTNLGGGQTRVVHPNYGTLTMNADGTYTYIPRGNFIGTAVFPYTACDGSACASASLKILVKFIFVISFPDINSGFINLPISGNVSTNDQIVSGSTYTPGALVSFANGNPLPAPVVNMVMNNDGSYTFTGDRAGVYVYNVTICPPGQSVGCPTENLTITLLNNTILTNPPVANTDIAIVNGWLTGGTPTQVVVSVLANDFAGDLTTSLNPLTLTITSAPANGTATVVDVNDSKGIQFNPPAEFDGLAVFHYQICDRKDPAECATGRVEVTVLSSSPVGVVAADDYANTNATVPLNGNVITNDLDLSTLTNTGLTVVPKSVDVAGYTLDIVSNGNYTFTAKPGFSGTVVRSYSVCNAANTFCTQATLYISVTNHITFDGVNGWVAGSSNGVPDEDDNDRNAYVFGETPRVENPVAVKNLYVAPSSELQMAACLTVNDGVQILGTVRFEAIDDNGDGTNPPVYGRYTGPTSENIIYEMSFSEEGWHNIAIPVTRSNGDPYTPADLVADNNNGGRLPVLLTADSASHNLWWYDTEFASGKELGFFITRPGESSYLSHSYGTQRMITDPSTALNRYGLLYYIDASYTTFPTKLRVTGKVNTEPVTYRTHDNWGGWNLIPNPFPSLLDVAKMNGADGVPSIFHQGGNISNPLEFDQAIYIWDAEDANVSEFDGLFKVGSYVAFDVQTGLSVDPNFLYVPGQNGLYIAPMQSFYLRRITASEKRRNNFGDPNPDGALGVAVGPNQTVAGTDGSTNDDDAERILNSNATNGELNITILPEHRGGCQIVRHFKKDWDVMMLHAVDMSNPKLADATELVFDHSFTDGIDVGYDIRKMSSKPGAPVLFTIIDGNALVINKMSYPKDGTSVPLGFYSNVVNGQFKIALPTVPNGWAVYLEDRKTGTWHNFQNGAYKFMNDTNFDIERFRLHFKIGAASIDDFHPGIKAWAVDAGIKVEFHNLISDEARVRITDVAGRVLFNQANISTRTDFLFPIQGYKLGVYTITVITPEQIITEKIVR
jgi:uncharacterized repeat protein (TIGR01451 family)